MRTRRAVRKQRTASLTTTHQLAAAAGGTVVGDWEHRLVERRLAGWSVVLETLG